MKKISIIIPCYNAEKTIERCAASLLDQTIGREGLELIFVNDGSKDRTYDKLSEIEARYPEEVLLIHLEENVGQGVARNTGIAYASGIYLGFVDADDYVEPDMYETLYKAAEQYGCDMAGGGYIRDVAREDSLPLEVPVTVDTTEKRKQLILRGTSVTFAARIYRTEFIRARQLYFPEYLLYEDNYWQSLLNMEIGTYYICRKSFYHYVETPGSSTKTMTEQNFLQSMQIQCMLVEEYRRRGLWEKFCVELLAKFLKSHTSMNLLGMYLEWKEIPEQIYRQMWEDVHQYICFPIENPYLWKADIGLIEEMFSEVLTEEERKRCMEQYVSLLQDGKIGEWQPVFEERRRKRCKEAKESWEHFCEQCFELGRHSRELQEDGSFMEEAERLLGEARRMERFEEGTAYLEQMLTHQGDYEKRLEAVSPILVYKGDTICYSVLNDFAEHLIAALKNAGEEVWEYDIEEQGAEGLTALCGRTFKAIIGFQTYLFGVHFKDGRNLHDMIGGPKFHFIFDHPLWMKEHFEQGPKEYYILTHGRDYQEFVQRYFAKEVKECFLLPPAGAEQKEKSNAKEKEENEERPLGLTFIGTWYDYRERLAFIRNTKGTERYLANRFLLIMKKNPALRAEEAFAQALLYYGIELDDAAFKQVLFEMKQVCFCIMTYYREKVVKSLLDAGIELHVYGESWEKSPLAAYTNLICHPQVTVEESLSILQKSKMSLNIMSWHKGGFTERIANTLLNGAVAVSDTSWYLEEHFADGKNIVLFDLREPEKLAERILYLQKQEAERKRIAAAGYNLALKEHTWNVRAGELLRLIEKVRKEK